MLSGGQEFVLIIIAMGMFGGAVRTAVRAKHGLPDHPYPPGGHRRGRRGQQDSDEVERLKTENARLTDRLEASEDRLAVLERIVTDKSYSLADEIESLRDREPGLEARSKIL